MRMSVVNVICNELHTQQVTVFPWEVPILIAIHDQGNVTEVGEKHEDRPIPDPHNEYDRLLARYKAHSESPDTPYVAEIYGAGPIGVRELGRAIQEHAQLSDEELAAAAAPPVDIEPILESLQKVNAEGAIAQLEQITDMTVLARIADEDTGDHRKTVRQAADDRLGRLAERAAA